MSLDTIDRIITHFEANIGSSEGIHVIYEDDNGDTEEPSIGPFIKLFIEPFTDEIEGIGLTHNIYREEGVVTAQLFIEKGENTKELYRYVSAIRGVYRWKAIQPEAGEEGPILFEAMDTRRVGYISKSNGYTRGRAIDWFRIDVSMTYRKDYIEILLVLITCDNDTITCDNNTITCDQIGL